MELEVGTVYLCEVWRVPPDLGCNGQEIQTGLFRFLGTQNVAPNHRTMICGDNRYEIHNSPEQELWEPADAVTFPAGTPVWKMIPIRPMKPEPEHELGRIRAKAMDILAGAFR